MRPSTWLLLPFLLAGCDPVSGPRSISGPTKYELDAKTEIKNGIRAYAVTKYTYYAINGGRKSELWSFTQNDKYEHHWISPQGRVWVATGSLPGPGGMGGIWTRDARGNRLIGLRYDMVLPPQLQHGRRYAAGSLDGVQMNKVEARTLGKNNPSEQLRLPLTDGGEGHVTLVNTALGGFIAVARAYGKGERDLLSDALEKSETTSPTFSRPVPRSPLALWEIREENTGKTNRILQTWQEATYGESSEGQVKPVTAERAVDLSPAAAIRTPSSNVLWFGFSQIGEPDAARLTIMKYDGKVIKEIDLLKLGGFQNSAEAKAKLAYRDVRIQSGNTFLSIDDSQFYAGGGPEELELREDDARTIIRINANDVVYERRTGLAARRPKEGIWPNAKIVRERRFTSPNGKFVFRERQIENGKAPDAYFETFLGKATGTDGKSSMVELWSTLSYAPISQARVLDSGRSFFVRAEPFDKGEAQRAVMVVNSPDGDQMGGIDLFQPPASFRTAAEALKKVRLDQMTVKAGGVALAREIEGVKYRAPVAETFRLPLGGGRVWEFQIGPRQFGPPGDGISWTSPSGR